MWLDMIHGTIERRVLLNYRLDPVTLQRVLPFPFRPNLYKGYGVGGVCMIRFRGLRPRPFPEWVGLGSENAANRIAVEWDQDGERREGVFISRRDTASRLNKIFGGRVFPGIFQRSMFQVQEDGASVSVRIVRNDGGEEVAFAGRAAESLPATSIFPSINEATGFFSLGATGYSPTHADRHYHGMELRCLNWTVAPLTIEEARSCFFGNTERFPAGTAELDCALLMRNVTHEWHSRPDLYTSAAGNSLTTHKSRRS
jgi:hypothetical protein